jgi:hypothetical protein
MFDTLKKQHVLHWHTKIEDYSPMLHYIEGPRNILANNLLRLHHLVTPVQIVEGKKLIEPAEVSYEEEGEVCVCVSWSLVKGVQVVKHAIPIANSCPH